MAEKRITLTIGTKDRPSEVGLLLQSLRTQTYEAFDILIIDDCSGTPLTNYYFIVYMVNRLTLEGHCVKIVRNNISNGVCAMRNQSVELALKFFPNNELMGRIDDDTLCEPDYLEKLVEVIDVGFDMASGLTPPLPGPEFTRDVNLIGDVINRVVLNDDGSFMINGDDCGHTYSEEKILHAHHFRSSAIYKKEIHTVHNIMYEDNLTKSGMREEEFFSFRIIMAGLKIGVHTGAIHYHLMTPSGGQRTASNEMHLQNQKILNRWVKKKVKIKGNFIEDYNQRNGLSDKGKFLNLYKSTNFLMTKEE